jgi:hypothetical protein
MHMFKCPNTGEMCQSYALCANRKDALENCSEDSMLADLIEVERKLSPELAEAESVSYCLDERIAAFGVVAATSSSSSTRLNAQDRADQLNSLKFISH